MNYFAKLKEKTIWFVNRMSRLNCRCAEPKCLVGSTCALNNMALPKVASCGKILANDLAPYEKLIVLKVAVAGIPEDASLDTAADLASLNKENSRSVQTAVEKPFSSTFIKVFFLYPSRQQKLCSDKFFPLMMPWVFLIAKPEDVFKVVKVQHDQ